MTKFLSLSSLIILPCFCHQVIAQESRVEMQAGRCSAIFFMLSETHKDNTVSAGIFQHFGSVFENLYVTEKKERVGNATRDDGIERRNLVLQEFKATYNSRPATLKEEVVLCGAWAEGYKIQGDNYTYVPIIPKLIPAAVRNEYEALAETGWKKWIAN
ncbi:MAG: hypothetical protein K9J47_05145 [Sulfuritalea sp.]|nr:hypothetical protein [Polynucleobacter sp.]MCF8188145.1 hypothetical protein [Sulfuritalea sp.]